MWKWLYVLPIAALLGIGTAGAQFGRDSAPGSTGGRDQQARPGGQNSLPTITSARDVVSAESDQLVRLHGRIVSRQDTDRYLFSDGTGSVVIEIDNGVLQGEQLGAGSELDIYGMVAEAAPTSPKVEVQAVTVVTMVSEPQFGRPSEALP
jgi:uncharacterized protein (TIGR00156 family)